MGFLAVEDDVGALAGFFVRLQHPGLHGAEALGALFGFASAVGDVILYLLICKLHRAIRTLLTIVSSCLLDWLINDRWWLLLILWSIFALFCLMSCQGRLVPRHKLVAQLAIQLGLLRVHIQLMLLLVCLGHYFSTLCAFIVLAGAGDLMQSVFGEFDGLLAHSAGFGLDFFRVLLYCFNHF